MLCYKSKQYHSNKYLLTENSKAFPLRSDHFHHMLFFFVLKLCLPWRKCRALIGSSFRSSQNSRLILYSFICLHHEEMNVIKCLPIRLELCDSKLLIGVALKESLSNHYGDGDNNARHSFSCLTIERSSHARFVRDLLFLRISQPFWSQVLDKKICFSFFFSIYECHIQVFTTRNTRISFH